MANDLSNKEQMTKDYMKGLLRATFPNLDLSDNGSFMETFGLPQLKLLEPLMNFADRIRLMQSLENAAAMTEEEMNEVAAKEYFYRDPGKRAVGYATLTFRDIPSTNFLQLNSGDVATSKTGLRFYSRDNLTIDETQLGNYYDPDSFMFKIPVAFVAENVGAQYNIEPGELTSLTTSLDYLDSITNEAAFTGGTDKESNISLANRIKEGANAPTLGVIRGYTRFIHDNFPDVIDVLPVGYGHPLMKRDIIGTITLPGFNQTVRDVHWGTKVDLYLRGERLQDYTENITVNLITASTDVGALLSQTPVYDIKSVSLVSNDPNIDPTTLVITNFVLLKDEDPETVGTRYEKAWVKITDGRVTTGTLVQVSYRYNALIQNVHDTLYNDDNRPPTADVLAKAANKKYVFGSILGKQLSSLRLTESDKSVIRQSAFTYIDSIKMGQEIQFSDVNEAILSDPINPILDFIHQPAQYLVLENNSNLIYYCLGETERGILEAAGQRNPFVQSALNAFKDALTVFDFFDCLHIMLFENGLDAALKALQAINYTWVRRVERFSWMRDIALKGKMLTLLSPATQTVQENEFFALGQLAVYEDMAYTRDDWSNLINLYESLSNTDVNNVNDLSMLTLACFCAMIAYVNVNQADLVMDNTPLFAHMQRAVRQTPIQDAFNL